MSTINGPVKGFRIIKGYIQLYQPSHPKAIQKKYVPLHRLLIELKIGRTLNENEVVHHKDGNKKNNDLKNLEIMEKLAHDVLSARFRKRNERGVFIRS